MSIKTWKNKELTTLLSEAWGFGFTLDNLNEDIADLKAWQEKQKGGKGATDDDDGDEDDEEAVEEGFERPKSASGAGPTNKAGKMERSDVANKDTSKFGQGGSKGGGKESAGGSVAAPKAGKMDRTDVANKASGRWLKEGEEDELGEGLADAKDPKRPRAGRRVGGKCGDGQNIVDCSDPKCTEGPCKKLDEMCPPEGHDVEGMDAGPESRAAELLDELKELIMQLQGGGVPGNRTYQEGEDAEELEERHKPPNVTQGRDSARRLKKASGERVEEQVRQLIRKSLKNLQEKKKK